MSRLSKSLLKLQGLKEAREGGVSRLDQLEVLISNFQYEQQFFYSIRKYVQLDDEGDVYDLVDEEKYAEIVEKRRNEAEFVVDDSKYFIMETLNAFTQNLNRRTWLS